MEVAHTSETGRLEAFSDGVFAVAITLLVLEIKVPTPAQAAGSLLRALLTQWPSFAAYLISFGTIGIMWINHHAMFQYIRRTDRNLMLLHIPFLLLVSFVPYSTSLVAAFLGKAEEKTAVLIYGAVFILIALAYNAIWWHGIRDPRLLGQSVHREGLRTISARYRGGPLLYLGATLLAFASAPASLVCHGALAAFFALPDRRRSK